jgi:hypothetical protein
MFILRAEIVTIFGSKMVTISARNTVQTYIQNMQTSQGYIFRILQHFVTKFYSFTNFNKLFTEIYFFWPRSKISLTCKDCNCLFENSYIWLVSPGDVVVAKYSYSHFVRQYRRVVPLQNQISYIWLLLFSLQPTGIWLVEIIRQQHLQKINIYITLSLRKHSGEVLQ